MVLPGGEGEPANAANDKRSGAATTEHDDLPEDNSLFSTAVDGPTFPDTSAVSGLQRDLSGIQISALSRLQQNLAGINSKALAGIQTSALSRLQQNLAGINSKAFAGLQRDLIGGRASASSTTAH